MRVLMFGWEFPPHISGGLGTACYGLTKGLNQIGGVEILFVVPKAYGDEDQSRISLIDAGEVVVSTRTVDYKGFFRRIHFIEVGSSILPYTTPEEYAKLMSKDEKGNHFLVNTTFSGKLTFSGGYGVDLFQEIANYAAIA